MVEGALIRSSFVTRRLVLLLVVGLLSLSGIAHAGARQDDAALRYKLIPLGVIKDHGGTAAFSVNAKGMVVGLALSGEFMVTRAVIYRGGKLRALIKGEGNNTSEARDINAGGQIIVMTMDAEGRHAMVWESDEGTLVSSPDGDVNLYSINDSGVAVGDVSHLDASIPTQPIVWQDGELTTLDVLTDDGSGSALNVNADGLVIGLSDVAKAETGEVTSRHAVAWKDGEVTDLGTLGGLYSKASGVNAVGQIVGSSATAEDQDDFGPGHHATLWENGEIVDLGTLGKGDRSSASAINADGDIVGSAAATTEDFGELHAVLWRDGQIYDLNELIEGGSDVVLENAHDINDDGLIVAVGLVGDFEQTFLLEPIEA